MNSKNPKDQSQAFLDGPMDPFEYYTQGVENPAAEDTGADPSSSGVEQQQDAVFNQETARPTSMDSLDQPLVNFGYVVGPPSINPFAPQEPLSPLNNDIYSEFNLDIGPSNSTSIFEADPLKFADTDKGFGLLYDPFNLGDAAEVREAEDETAPPSELLNSPPARMSNLVSTLTPLLDESRPMVVENITSSSGKHEEMPKPNVLMEPSEIIDSPADPFTTVIDQSISTMNVDSGGAVVSTKDDLTYIPALDESEKAEPVCHVSKPDQEEQSILFSMDVHNPLICKECGMGFADIGSLGRHEMRMHNGEALVTCSRCGEAMKNKYNLERHLMIVHPEKSAFRCNLCNVPFSGQKTLALHKLKTHGIPLVSRGKGRRKKASEEDLRANKKIKKYRCKMCKYSSPWKRNVDRHHDGVHVRNRKYHCPKCKRRFTTKDNMNVHKCSRKANVVYSPSE